MHTMLRISKVTLVSLQKISFSLSSCMWSLFLSRVPFSLMAVVPSKLNHCKLLLSRWRFQRNRLRTFLSLPHCSWKAGLSAHEAGTGATNRGPEKAPGQLSCTGTRLWAPTRPSTCPLRPGPRGPSAHSWGPFIVMLLLASTNTHLAQRSREI